MVRSAALCWSNGIPGTKTTSLLLLMVMWQLSLTWAKERRYYLAAVDQEWDYSPKGGHTTNVAYNAEFYLKSGSERIGSIYKKTVFKLYTNEHFSEEKPMKSWQGIVGAIMRAEVGDTVHIHFYNKASKPYSVHPHGALYDKLNEGAVYKGRKKTGGDQVAAGDTFEYKWEITKAAGPAQGDDACIPWPFHSHGEDPEKDVNTGLIGVLLVCKPDILNDKDERKDVNREFVVLLKVFDENHTWHTSENLHKCGKSEKCQKLLEKGDHDFLASNYMHALNGYMYAHGAPFSVCGGDKVVWHVLGFGGQLDLHSFTVDGESLTVGPERVISAEVMPSTFVTVAMTATAPGKKLVMCAVSSHFEEGMSAFLDVHDCGVELAPLVKGKVRKFNLMIDQVLWDYAPTGMDLYSGSALMGEGSDYSKSKYFEAGHDRIGSVYKKLMYFGYKDAGFKERLYRHGSDKHLGFLGPVLRVEEGDTLQVLLYNNASKPFSFFPYGLWPADPKKIDKGGLHNVAVEPKSQHTYVFTVPPGGKGAKGAPPCVTSMYHSAVDPVRDMHTGLVGALLICKKGSLDHEGNQKEGEERVLFMAVVDENLSWLIDYNIEHYAISSKIHRHDSDFWESNRMHSVNGLMYGNIYGLDFCKWETVFWHVFTLGDESDVQGVHFHGLNFEVEGRISDTVPVFSGKTNTLQTKVSQTGTYTIQCTNLDHFKAGMFVFYSVDDCNDHDRRRRREANKTHTAGVHHARRNPRAETPQDQKTIKRGNFSIPRQSQSRNPKLESQHGLSEGQDSQPRFLPFRVAIKNLDKKGGTNSTHAARNESDHNPNLKTSDGRSMRRTNAKHHANSTSKYKQSNSTHRSISKQRINLDSKIHGGNSNIRETTQNQTDAYVTPKPNRNTTRLNDTKARSEAKPEPELYKAEVKGEKKADVKEAGKGKKKKKKGEPGIRKYFIAAEEIDWDYNPPWGAMGSDRRKRSASSSVYRKAVFRQYEDHTFSKPVERGKADKHLGILGPFIRGQEGETLHVTFMNKANKPYSMYAHMMAADKENEGAAYKDKSGIDKDGKVFPGETYVYKWKVTVPENQASPCFSSLYYSSHSYPKDLYSGLVGPLVICKKGVLNEQGVRGDVQKEFALLFAVFDENESKYVTENIHHFSGFLGVLESKSSSSNKMFSINGYTHQHIPGLEMVKEDTVAWHILSFGSSHDVHSVHFHGQPVVMEAGGPHVMDTVGVLPEVSKDLLMTAVNPGEWMIHCDVSSHAKAGEVTTYTVKGQADPADIKEVKPKAPPVPLEKQLELIKQAAKEKAKQAAIQKAAAELQAAAKQKAAIAAAAKKAAAEAKLAVQEQAAAKALAEAEGAKLGETAAKAEIKELQRKAEKKAAKAENLQEAKQDAAAKAAAAAKAEVSAKNDAGLKPVILDKEEGEEEEEEGWEAEEEEEGWEEGGEGAKEEGGGGGVEDAKGEGGEEGGKLEKWEEEEWGEKGGEEEEGRAEGGEGHYDYYGSYYFSSGHDYEGEEAEDLHEGGEEKAGEWGEEKGGEGGEEKGGEGGEEKGGEGGEEKGGEGDEEKGGEGGEEKGGEEYFGADYSDHYYGHDQSEDYESSHYESYEGSESSEGSKSSEGSESSEGSKSSGGSESSEGGGGEDWVYHESGGSDYEGSHDEISDESHYFYSEGSEEYSEGHYDHESEDMYEDYSEHSYEYSD